MGRDGAANLSTCGSSKAHGVRIPGAALRQCLSSQIPGAPGSPASPASRKIPLPEISIGPGRCQGPGRDLRARAGKTVRATGGFPSSLPGPTAIAARHAGSSRQVILGRISGGACPGHQIPLRNAAHRSGVRASRGDRHFSRCAAQIHPVPNLRHSLTDADPAEPGQFGHAPIPGAVSG